MAANRLASGDEPAGADPVTGEATDARPSPSSMIREELETLVEDGKTYAEAELAFQKTRLSFAADRGKSVVILAVLALGFVHLMLIALVVGAVFALAPIVGGLEATGIVVGTLLLLTIIFGLMIRSKIRDVTAAFAKPEA